MTDLATQSPPRRSRPPTPTTPRGAPCAAPNEISRGAVSRKRFRPSTGIPPTGVPAARGECVACYNLSNNRAAAMVHAKTCTGSRLYVQLMRGVQPIPAVSDVENRAQDGEQDGVQVRWQMWSSTTMGLRSRNAWSRENSEFNEDDSKWPHNYHISRANVPHRESLLELATTTQTQARIQNGRPRCECVDKEMFRIVTQQAAVHLGNDYMQNLHSTKNQPQRRVKQLFDVTIDWQEN